MKSPESPRRTETSPFSRLTLATPRPGPSSGSCAHTGALNPHATTNITARVANMAFAFRPVQCTRDTKVLSCCSGRPASRDDGTARWLKTTTVLPRSHQKPCYAAAKMYLDIIDAID